MVVAVPITEDFINVSFFTIYYAWISYAFKSYIDNYFTHYQERRWRLKLQKTSLRLPLKKKEREKKTEFFFSQQIPLALVANPPVFTPISHQIWENINKWRRYSEMPGRYQSPDRLLYVHLQYFFLWNYSILHKGYLLSIHGKSIWELGSFPLYRCAL